MLVADREKSPGTGIETCVRVFEYEQQIPESLHHQNIHRVERRQMYEHIFKATLYLHSRNEHHIFGSRYST